MEYHPPMSVRKDTLPPLRFQGPQETASDSLSSSGDQIGGSNSGSCTSVQTNMQGAPFSEQFTGYGASVPDDLQYAQPFFSRAFGTPRLPFDVSGMNEHTGHLDMFLATRLANGTPYPYPSFDPFIDEYTSSPSLGTGQYTNNQLGQEWQHPPEQWPEDLLPAANFDTSLLLEAEPDLGAPEDDRLFEEDGAVAESSESTRGNFDYNADQVLKPSEIAQLYDGRSPHFAPYPVPIHDSAARAILQVPFARPPIFSLLAMNPRNQYKVMREFPPPWMQNPNNITLYGILREWVNHLWYEGLDGFIQIRTAAPNITTFLTPDTWALLRKYGICTTKPGRNQNSWLQRRLDNRKEVLGQAYIEALEQAPRIRAAGADFGSDSKNIARVRVKKSGKADKSATALALVTQDSGNEDSEQQTKQKMALTSRPQSAPAVKATTSNSPNLATKSTAPVIFTTEKTASKLLEFAGKPITSASTAKMASMSVATTKLPKELPSLRKSATTVRSVPKRYTPSSSTMQSVVQQTSVVSNPPPPSLPNVMTPFDLPSNQPLLSFYVKNISAQSTPDNPCGMFFDMDFWDSPEQYGTVKKEFADRTHQCMKLAGKLLAADPVLSAASVPLQLESIVTLIGRDILSRPAELLNWNAAFLKKVSKWPERKALRYAFGNAFDKVIHLCLSDALEEAVYIGLLNAFGPTAHQNPTTFTYELLTDVRSAAVACVTQTQAELHGLLQQWLQSQQANPAGFKLRRLLQTALSASSGTVSSAMSEFLGKPSLVNNTLNTVNAVGGAFSGRANMPLAGKKVRRGLPQDGSAGFILKKGGSDVYLREDSSTPTALNTVQAPPLFTVAAAHGVKRTRNPNDTDDVFYDGDPEELRAKRFKPTVPNATRVHRPSLFQGNAFSERQSISADGVDQAMLTVDDDGIATINFQVKADPNPVLASSNAIPAASLHCSDVTVLEELEKQAEYGHTEGAWPTTPILFQGDILTMLDVGEAAYREELESHYRGGAPGMHEQWTLE